MEVSQRVSMGKIDTQHQQSIRKEQTNKSEEETTTQKERKCIV